MILWTAALHWRANPGNMQRILTSDAILMEISSRHRQVCAVLWALTEQQIPAVERSLWRK